MLPAIFRFYFAAPHLRDKICEWPGNKARPRVNSITCDPLSENPALSANIEFEVRGKFICTSRSLTKLRLYLRITVGFNCVILKYEAGLCYYEDDISSNSQAGQRNTGTRCHRQLVRVFEERSRKVPGESRILPASMQSVLRLSFCP